LNRLLEGKVEERTVERDRIWNISHDPFVIADGSGVWLAASPAWTALLGWTEDELVGRTSEWMEHPEDVARTRAEDRRLAPGETTTRFVNRFRRRDGTYRYLSWTAVPYEGRFYSVARDITDERERARALEAAEAALRQSQKMESIGQITGGLAHDFNNLLSPIVGALDLLQRRQLPDPRLRRLVEGASESAERARVLVQRLLAFARRQPLRTVPVDLSALVGGIVALVESTVGSRTAVEVEVEEHLPPALADANQLEMAILNLAVNARDAMPDGGRLRLAVELVQVLPDDGGELSPGKYIVLSVADTGVGMQPAVVERAIEPFFTTKGMERGTGLGLSMVHGLVAQLGGDLRITSMPGEGTTVSLRLPVATKLAKIDHQVQSEPSGEERGTATILLVDDEPLVRAGTAQSLMELGFSVIQAESAEAALYLLQRHPEIRLVVTDHLMPGMTGTELARSLLLSRSDLPLLIVSGYADVDDIAPDFPRLAKPFRLSELEQAIQALMRRAA
jgi:PAS domain S-box-containing protein